MAYRSGELAALKKIADEIEVKPSMILHSKAIKELRPDLWQKILNGVIDYDDARDEVYAVFIERLLQAVELVDR